MYSQSVCIEKHSNTISDVVGLFGIDYDQCFGSIEEMSAYIEGLLLGISSIYPFVRGVFGYEKDGDQVKLIEKTIVGADKINALGRYMRNEFSLSDCKFIPELSQKHSVSSLKDCRTVLSLFWFFGTVSSGQGRIRTMVR